MGLRGGDLQAHRNIADQLNQSCTNKQILSLERTALERYVQPSPSTVQRATAAKTQNIEDKFETEELSDRSARGAEHDVPARTSPGDFSDEAGQPASRTAMHGMLRQVAGEDEEYKAEQTAEATDFQIIPEHSMEVSDSVRNSNKLEDTRHLRGTAAGNQRHLHDAPGCSIYDSKEVPAGQTLRSLGPQHRMKAFQEEQETQNRRSAQQNVDQMDSKGRTQHVHPRVLTNCLEDAYLLDQKYNLTEESVDEARRDASEQKALTFKSAVNQLNLQQLHPRGRHGAR